MSHLPARLAPAGLLAGVLLLTACATPRGLAPEFAPVDADTLEARRSLGSGEADFPRDTWWHDFGDKQLDRLMDEALAEGPSMRIAHARLLAARAQAGLADAERTPSLSSTLRYSALQLPESMLGEAGGSLRGSGVVTFDFAWSPDLWGAQRAQWEAAVDEAHAREADGMAAWLALSGELARRYFALAEAFEARTVAERELARADVLAELARQRVNAGLDSELPVHNANTAIGIARQQVEAAEQQIKAQRFAIAALLGKGPDRGLDIEQPAILTTPAPLVPEVLPSELIGHRPDVAAARWRVEAAARHVAAAKASFRPSVNLTAMLGAVAPSLSALFNSDSVFTLSGPALNLPVFDGGRRRASLSGRHAEYDLAVANYNQMLVIALQQVADALNAARALDAQLAMLGDALESARAAHALALKRHEGGLGTQLEVLAVQRPLLELEQQLTSLRARRLGAATDLNLALGGGLPRLPDASPRTPPHHDDVSFPPH